MVTWRALVVTAFGVAARTHTTSKGIPGALLISKSEYEFKLGFGE
jgi:hypothetical protein